MGGPPTITVDGTSVTICFVPDPGVEIIITDFLEGVDTQARILVRATYGTSDPVCLTFQHMRSGVHDISVSDSGGTYTTQITVPSMSPSAPMNGP